MTQPEQERYRLVLQQRPMPNDLVEMTEAEVDGTVRTRPGADAAEAVLQELEEKGVAATDFDPILGPRARVEIRRVGKSESVG